MTSDIDLLWRIRFGEPPPIRTDRRTALRVLEAFDHLPAPRLCLDAVVLEREAQQACAELRAVRERSRRLMAEARALAG